MRVPFLAICFTAVVAGIASSTEGDGYAYEWGDNQRDLERLARKVKEKGDWYKVDIDGFAVRSRVSAAFTAELAFYIQRMAAQYQELFPGRPTVGNTCEVIVHDDPGDYENAVRAMQVTTGGTSRRAEFIWSWDPTEKRIQSYGLHLYAKAGETLADIPRPELNGALLRCLNQRLVGQNPMPPWFAVGVTTWMGSFEPERSLEENMAAHSVAWKPDFPFDPDQPLEKSLVLADLFEKKPGAIGGDDALLCAAFLQYLALDKKANKTLKEIVDDMTKSRPVKFEKKEVRKLERGFLSFLARAG